MSSGSFDALIYGARLGVSFNPAFAAGGAALAAAMLASVTPRHRHPAWGLSLLAVAWLIGDALRIVARARDHYDGVGTVLVPGGWTTEVAVALATWALVSLVVGYALPTWAGAFVGRRVTHGTGWLAAGSIAAASAVALSVFGSAVAG